MQLHHISRRFGLYLCAVLAFLASPAAANDASPPGAAFDVAAQAVISPAELVERLTAVDVVMLGERHDNPVHHQWQAWIVGGLDDAVGVGGLAFEMIPEHREADAAAHLESVEGEARAAGLGAAIGWEESGWPDWALYAPIVAAAPNAIVTGGGIERNALRAFAKDPSGWPRAEDYGVTSPLGAQEQAVRQAEQIAAHCDALPSEFAPVMVTAQRIWDASFAAAALRAKAETGATVAILGNGHARRDRGAPLALSHVAPEATVGAVGMVEVAEDPQSLTQAAMVEAATGSGRFDFVLFTPVVERDDPCAAFDKPKAKSE